MQDVEHGKEGWTDYHSLEVYRRAHALGVQLHVFTLRLPKYELYETGSQLRRASKAVTETFVEGYGRRRYKAEFIRFLIYASASNDEAREAVEYIRDCYPELASDASAFIEELNIVGRMLNRFLHSVEQNHRSVK